MLSEKDQHFIKYWEKEREGYNTLSSKILRGLPVAMLFNLPVLVLILVVYLFFPEWYTKISGTSQGAYITVVIAIILCTLFFAYFRMHYKWEMNEQLYKELKNKAGKSEKTNNKSTVN